jgi:hypothetical protein
MPGYLLMSTVSRLLYHLPYRRARMTYIANSIATIPENEYVVEESCALELSGFIDEETEAQRGSLNRIHILRSSRKT